MSDFDVIMTQRGSGRASKGGTFILLFGVAALYVVIACTVFQFRHPWATETECFLNIPRAMLFQKVSYQEMRPR